MWPYWSLLPVLLLLPQDGAGHPWLWLQHGAGPPWPQTYQPEQPQLPPHLISSPLLEAVTASNLHVVRSRLKQVFNPDIYLLYVRLHLLYYRPDVAGSVLQKSICH